MKAIILAAGVGSRISEKIGGVPKSVLPLPDGTPILRRSVNNMLACGIEPVVCVGYRKEKIREALQGLPVRYYENPFYRITNNIASLWFAHEEFHSEDVLLTSADLYYPQSFLERLQQTDAGLSMLVDSARIESGDFYFSLDPRGRIDEYGPKVPLERRNFEYMGLTKIGVKRVAAVREQIDRSIEEGKFDRYFEDVLISLHMEGGVPIEFIDVAGEFWREFDYYEDYEIIMEHERSAGT